MPKEKETRLKLSDGIYLEGKQFDWCLITVTEGTNKKTGEPTLSERRHYFPKLTQIASYLVSEQAKKAGDYTELVDVINQSTQVITERLMGVEERLSQQGNTATIESVTDGEVNGADANEEKDAKPAKSTARRRSRKKKTAN